MKRFLLIASLVGYLMLSCNKIPIDWIKNPKPGKLIITDLNGKALKAAQAGSLLRLQSPEIARLIKEGFFQEGGEILFDKEVAEIKEVKDDIVLLTLPTLNYYVIVDIEIIARLRNVLFPLCRPCLLYRPTISGAIYAGSRDGVTENGFEMPAEMVIDAARNLYVIDQRLMHDRIIKVLPDGTTSVFAGGSNEFGRLVGIGLSPDASLLYVSDATQQRVLSINTTTAAINTLAGSGTAGNTNGTGTAASFNFNDNEVSDFGQSETGQGLTVDAAGNILVGEEVLGVTFGSQIRRITPAGVVSLFPGSRIEPMEQNDAALPSGLTIDAAGNLHYVSGSSGFFQGITRINPAGGRIRLAGQTSFEGLEDGNGTAAQFSYPKAIANKDGFLYVADGTNGALRRISATGEVVTLAGVGHFLTDQFCGCGAPVGPVQGSYGIPIFASDFDYETAAQSIRMNQTGGVAAFSTGEIYVADYGYKCIWRISLR